MIAQSVSNHNLFFSALRLLVLKVKALTIQVPSYIFS